jgi:hypothetical protein
MEIEHGEDLRPQHGQAPSLPLLDHTHLNSIISFGEGRNSVGAASLRAGGQERLPGAGQEGLLREAA